MRCVVGRGGSLYMNLEVRICRNNNLNAIPVHPKLLPLCARPWVLCAQYPNYRQELNIS